MLVTVHAIEAGWLRIIDNKTKVKHKKKKYINLRDHQNNAIVADTGSPVINDIRIFFRSALKIFSFESIKTKNKKKTKVNKQKHSPVTATQASTIFDIKELLKK